MTGIGEKLCTVGKVVGTRGLRGELKVRIHPDDWPALLEVRRIVLHSGQGRSAAFTAERMTLYKGLVLLSLKGHTDISAVQEFVGWDLLIAPEEVSRQAGQYFWFELEGCAVVDRERGEIGTLVDRFVTAAHGIYVVEGRFGEILIPAIPPFVENFDAEAGRLMVDVPEGLYPDSP